MQKENHQPRITVIGSSNIDIAATVLRPPALGETLKCVNSKISPGGKGANQAVAAAKTGAKVDFITKIGDDIFGEMIISNLESCGIGTEHVLVTKEADTGKALIVICGGDNQIIIDGGSNDKLTTEDIEKHSDLLINSDGVILQLEIPLPTVEKAIEICKEKTPIFLNPAPATHLDRSTLDGIDYFLPNETECSFYTGIIPDDELKTKNALNILLSYGIKFPIITLGSRGVAYFNGSESVIANAYAIDAIDSTAAGDTFAGAFSSMIAAGRSIAAATDFAQAAAAITCTRYGAQIAVPSKEEVEIFLSRHS